MRGRAVPTTVWSRAARNSPSRTAKKICSRARGSTAAGVVGACVTRDTSVDRGTVDHSEAFPAARHAPSGGPKGIAQQAGVKHVIAVMSGKGGVGKSLVAGLLAVGLHRRGMRIGILDGDITGPSIPRMFGVREKPAVVPGTQTLKPPTSRTGIPIMSMNLILPSEE